MNVLRSASIATLPLTYFPRAWTADVRKDLGQSEGIADSARAFCIGPNRKNVDLLCSEVLSDNVRLVPKENHTM